MIFKELNIQGVFLIELNPLEDKRGFFMRTYDIQLFESQDLNHRILKILLPSVTRSRIRRAKRAEDFFGGFPQNTKGMQSKSGARSAPGNFQAPFSPYKAQYKRNPAREARRGNF